MWFAMFVLFFQAEDGIRDIGVTGVQTCALPICRPIAGVAWAQTRGVGAVEVRVDDGPWMPAQLSPQVDADLWRQWVLPHDFAPGSYQLTVRATRTDEIGRASCRERV